jgi:hypothetical protein
MSYSNVIFETLSRGTRECAETDFERTTTEDGFDLFRRFTYRSDRLTGVPNDMIYHRVLACDQVRSCLIDGITFHGYRKALKGLVILMMNTRPRIQYCLTDVRTQGIY